MTRPTWLDCTHEGIGLPGCPTCDGREDSDGWRGTLAVARDYILALEARVQPQPSLPPLADDLAFAREVAPGLAWQENGVDVFADLPTGRAIAGDGHVTVGSHWVVVVVGGYRLRRDLTRRLTLAEARHVLHGFGQRLARSTLDFRRRAGLAILAAMEER